MKHLILYANPVSPSFCQYIRESINHTSTEAGDEVIIRDLYNLDFQPVLTKADLTGFRNHNIAPEILEEQKLINNANLITLIYPIWWAGMPAILKGYIDRVFSYGFAYQNQGKEIVGMLYGKKVIIINTYGQSEEEYNKLNMFNALNITVDLGIFDFCGVEVLNHFYFRDTSTTEDEKKQEFLDELEEYYTKLTRKYKVK